MPKVILTDARVKVLRPRRTAYDIRDGKLRGFGVRVLPSGRKRFFVHSQHRRERVWNILGDAATMSLDEARSRAVRTLAAIRRGEDPPRDPAETLFEAVAETVFERYRRLWKPRTLDVNRCYLKNQILPRFHGRQVADINRRDVRDWFASLRADAGRRRPVHAGALRHLEEAEAMGLRPQGSNPCLGIRRSRRKGLCCKLGEGAMRNQGASCSPYDSALARRSCSHAIGLGQGARSETEGALDDPGLADNAALEGEHPGLALAQRGASPRSP